MLTTCTPRALISAPGYDEEACGYGQLVFLSRPLLLCLYSGDGVVKGFVVLLISEYGPAPLSPLSDICCGQYPPATKHLPWRAGKGEGTSLGQAGKVGVGANFNTPCL